MVENSPVIQGRRKSSLVPLGMFYFCAVGCHFVPHEQPSDFSTFLQSLCLNRQAMRSFMTCSMFLHPSWRKARAVSMIMSAASSSRSLNSFSYVGQASSACCSATNSGVRWSGGLFQWQASMRRQSLETLIDMARGDVNSLISSRLVISSCSSLVNLLSVIIDERI